MKKTRTLILNYHEFVSKGHPTDKFCLLQKTFEQHLQLLKAYKINVVNVSDLFGTSPLEKFNVVICIDDGCASDREIAAPLLTKYGYSATFYPVTNFINSANKTTTAQIQELHEMGFEIGSHSLSHNMFPGISPDELINELKASKKRLNEIINDRVQSFSTPHGWVNRAVVSAAQNLAYQHLLGTGLRINTDPDQFVQYKWNMTENSTKQLEKLLKSGGRLPFHIMFKEWSKRRIKGLLGPKLIDRIGS